jgi:parvulin-like peptidyl-prolyl isomerase
VNKSRFETSEQVKARHILFKNTSSESEKKLEELRKQITPKNFAKLARLNTEEDAGKRSGGELGWFGKGIMDPEFEKAAFAIPKGQISGVVKSGFGLHLIYVEDKKPASKIDRAVANRELAKELVRAKDTEAITKRREEITKAIESQIASKTSGAIIQGVSIRESDFMGLRNFSLLGPVNSDVRMFAFSQPDRPKSFDTNKGRIVVWPIDRKVVATTSDGKQNRAKIARDQKAQRLMANFVEDFKERSSRQIKINQSILDQILLGQGRSKTQ